MRHIALKEIASAVRDPRDRASDPTAEWDSELKPCRDKWCWEMLLQSLDWLERNREGKLDECRSKDDSVYLEVVACEMKGGNAAAHSGPRLRAKTHISLQAVDAIWMEHQPRRRACAGKATERWSRYVKDSMIYGYASS